MRTTGHGDEREGLTLAGRARREQILDAAADVVAEVGYAKASTTRIADRAGISKGVLTYHFQSKDEIMKLVAVRLLDGCARHVESGAAITASASARIENWLRSELEFFAVHRTGYLAMSEILVNHRDPDFSRAFDRETIAETRRMAQLLTLGKEQGEFREFDSDRIARIILQCRNGVLDDWARDENQDLRVVANEFLDFIRHAITAPRRPAYGS